MATYLPFGNSILATECMLWQKHVVTWPVEKKQHFTKIWPSDLLFDPDQPMIKPDQEIIKTSVLTKFDIYWDQKDEVH